jgi:hypothetical protein
MVPPVQPVEVMKVSLTYSSLLTNMYSLPDRSCSLCRPQRSDTRGSVAQKRLFLPSRTVALSTVKPFCEMLMALEYEVPWKTMISAAAGCASTS